MIDLTCFFFSFGTSALAVSTSSRKSTEAIPAALTMEGVPSRVMPMKGHLLAADLEDLIGLERRGPRVARRVLPEDVGAEVLEGGALEVLPARARVLAVRTGAVRKAAALLHAQQLVHALVELVVAHRGDVEVQEVHGLDRRLVVEGSREQRAGADQVTGSHRERGGPRGA